MKKCLQIHQLDLARHFGCSNGYNSALRCGAYTMILYGALVFLLHLTAPIFCENTSVTGDPAGLHTPGIHLLCFIYSLCALPSVCLSGAVLGQNIWGPGPSPVSSLPFPFLTCSRPSSSSFLLEVGPINTARDSGEHCKLPSGVWCGAQEEIIFFGEP